MNSLVQFLLEITHLPSTPDQLLNKHPTEFNENRQNMFGIPVSLIYFNLEGLRICFLYYSVYTLSTINH